jgi:hypothetical protein
MLTEESFLVQNFNDEPEPEIPNQSEYDLSDLNLSEITIENSRFIAKYLNIYKNVVKSINLENTVFLQRMDMLTDFLG